MNDDEIRVAEKQIAKEILLALIEKGAIAFYADHDAQNVKNATDAFTTILKTVSD